MSISSLIFIFVFLPVCVAAYYILPGILKNVFLLLASLIFYAWGNPSYLIILGLSMVFNYFTALEMQSCIDSGSEKGARIGLVTGIVFNVAVLGFFKYYGFVIDNLNALFHASLPKQELPLPVGISFFTFSVLSYLIDVYRQDEPAQVNFIDYGVFVAFFAKITSGPIVRYVDFAPQLGAHRFNRTEITSGVAMFIRGLGKKILLADSFGNMYSQIAALPDSQMTVLLTWLMIGAFTLQIYFDFGGYSDMAIGIGKMFGFAITKNFDYPYTSLSATEFWRRWHITLGAWFREYIYIPLGGNREGALKHIRNIMIVWLLTGIWHGAAWTFIVWGLYYGVLLLIEKYLLKGLLDSLPEIVCHIYTMLAVMIGWTFFASPSIGAALHTLAGMFGRAAGGFADGTVWYFLRSNLIQLVLGCLMCSPWFYKKYKRFAFGGSRAKLYASCAIYAAVFVGALAYLIGATYQSFLYVNF